MDSKVDRTFQYIAFIVLFFCGPPGWACIYLLDKEWNPQQHKAPVKK